MKSLVVYKYLLVHNLQLREFVEMAESIGVIGTIGIIHEVEPSGGCLPHITALRPRPARGIPGKHCKPCYSLFYLHTYIRIIYTSDSYTNQSL